MANIMAQIGTIRGILLGVALLIWLAGLVTIARRKKVRSLILYLIGAAFVVYYEVHMALYWLGIGIVLVTLGWLTATERQRNPGR